MLLKAVHSGLRLGWNEIRNFTLRHLVMVLIVHDIIVVERLQIVFSQCGVVVVLERWKRVLLVHQLRDGALVDFSSRASGAATLGARRAGRTPIRSPALPAAGASDGSPLHTSRRHWLGAQGIVTALVPIAPNSVHGRAKFNRVKRSSLRVVISPH